MLKHHTPVATETNRTLPMIVTSSRKWRLESSHFDRTEDAIHVCERVIGVEIVTHPVGVTPVEDVITLAYVELHSNLTNVLKVKL